MVGTRHARWPAALHHHPACFRDGPQAGAALPSQPRQPHICRAHTDRVQRLELLVKQHVNFGEAVQPLLLDLSALLIRADGAGHVQAAPPGAGTEGRYA